MISFKPTQLGFVGLQIAALSGSSALALPAGYTFAIDPATPGTLRDASNNPLTAASFGVQVADIYNPANALVASQTTGSLRGKWLGPGVGETGFLWLPGVVGNYASVPASADDDFGTGDFAITVRLKGLSLAAGVKTLVMNRSGATGFDFQVSTATPRIVINGATIHTATAALSSAPEWIRVRRVSTVFKFETSADGSSWTQLGTDVTVTASPTASTGLLQVGQYTSGQNLAARVYHVVVNKAGVDGIILDFTNSTVPHGVASFVTTTGQTVTINRAGADCASIVRGGVLCTDGVDDRWALTTPFMPGTKVTYGAVMARQGTRAVGLGGDYINSPIVSTASITAASNHCQGTWSSAIGQNLQVVVMSLDDATSVGPTSLYVDNATTDLGPTGAFSPSATSLTDIGKALGTFFSAGQVGRMAAYDSVLDSTKRRQLMQWLAAPYGITIP